jgi:hypothetical protein
MRRLDQRVARDNRKGGGVMMFGREWVRRGVARRNFGARSVYRVQRMV